MAPGPTNTSIDEAPTRKKQMPPDPSDAIEFPPLASRPRLAVRGVAVPQDGVGTTSEMVHNINQSTTDLQTTGDSDPGFHSAAGFPMSSTGQLSRVPTEAEVDKWLKLPLLVEDIIKLLVALYERRVAPSYAEKLKRILGPDAQKELELAKELSDVLSSQSQAD